MQSKTRIHTTAALPMRACSIQATPLTSTRSISGTYSIKKHLQLSHNRQPTTSIHRRSPVSVEALRNIDWPEALLFDCDGVLVCINTILLNLLFQPTPITHPSPSPLLLQVDTEAEGHRVAFNEAFKRKSLNHQWSLEQYGVLLEIGGGKERMNHYFSSCSNQEPWLSTTDPDQRKSFLKELHELKTDIFNELIESGKLPLRPGVKRLIEEAMDNGVKVAVCSTSNERAVSNIVKVMLGPRIFENMRVYAGDVVPKKKPAPDIYNLAAKELGVEPARCVVIEDSQIGLAAAKAAGMRCIVTQSYYTKNEEFRIADAVFDYIGEATDERFSLNDLTTPGIVELKKKSVIALA